MLRSLIFLCACVCSAADLTGTWDLTAQSEGKDVKVQLVLRDDGGKLAGSISSEQGSMDLEEVKVAGDQLTYKIPYHGGITMALKASGNSMAGTFTTAEGVSGTIEAMRGAAAAAPAAKAAGPAVSGVWNLTAQPAGMSLRLELNQSAEKLAGSLTPGNGEPVAVQDLKLEGSDVTFNVAVNGGTYSVKLTVSGSSMKGTFTGPEGSTGTIEGGR
jgi:hypothetical protein